MMDHELYAFADSEFYQDPWKRLAAKNTFRACSYELPKGWKRSRSGPWCQLDHEDHELPEQGWKIHVTGTLRDADRIIDEVWSYCIAERLSFKFLNSRQTTIVANSKYADRRASGKLMTVYPASDDALRMALHHLDQRLAGTPGPYILSDRRWRDGPLYVRYGAFIHLECEGPDGEPVPAVRAPNGELVPDERGVVFTAPPWAPVPVFLEEALRDREEDGGDDFPFEVKRALHFSNGGGVYLAVDERTGRDVVLREARPFAGLDAAGVDAVGRLKNELEIREKLSGCGVAPQLYEYRTVWEHHYLVEEYISGETLESKFIAGHPLMRPDATVEQVADYTKWALGVVDQISDAVEKLHRLGVVHGDLHPGNIMVEDDGGIRFLDFEASHLADGATRSHIGATGFASPAARGGFAPDQYSLAMLRLYLLFPLPSLISLSPGKASEAADYIEGRYPVPAGYAHRAVDELRRSTGGTLPAGPGRLEGRHSASWPRPEPADPAWREVLDSLGAAIKSARFASDTAVLAPGDIEQFRGAGALNLTNGAAGVLWALHSAGISVNGSDVSWLWEHAWKRQNAPVGLYNGIHGIAWVLRRLGRPQEAYDLIIRTRDADLTTSKVDLATGLSGIALNLLDAAATFEDETFRVRSLVIAERLRGLFLGRDTDLRLPRRAGAMLGAAGAILLFVRLFEETDDDRWLDAARKALQHDLASAQYQHGLLGLPDDNNRLLPYLAEGTLGLGLVARHYLRHRSDTDFVAVVQASDYVCRPEFTYAPGLFEGRAGMIYYLAARSADGDAPSEELLRGHLDRLRWHAMLRDGKLVFPGRRLVRLSCDVATGSAGVLLGLQAATEGGLDLPFLT